MSITGGIIVPRMLDPFQWNLGAKGALIFAGTGFCCFIYCIFRLPETKYRSYGELDLLFEHRVAAWRFKSTKVDRECFFLLSQTLRRGLTMCRIRP